MAGSRERRAFGRCCQVRVRPCCALNPHLASAWPLLNSRREGALIHQVLSPAAISLLANAARGDGKDSLSGESAFDFLHGDVQEHRVEGGTHHDSIDGQSLKDWLCGTDGSDAIDGGSGIDDCSGGAGNDELKGCNP